MGPLNYFNLMSPSRLHIVHKNLSTKMSLSSHVIFHVNARPSSKMLSEIFHTSNKRTRALPMQTNMLIDRRAKARESSSSALLRYRTALGTDPWQTLHVTTTSTGCVSVIVYTGLCKYLDDSSVYPPVIRIAVEVTRRCV